jgi:hypothetical protein
LADWKAEDGTVFGHFVGVTPTDFEVFQQITGYKTSSYTVFSLVQILST